MADGRNIGGDWYTAAALEEHASQVAAGIPEDQRLFGQAEIEALQKQHPALATPEGRRSVLEFGPRGA